MPEIVELEPGERIDSLGVHDWRIIQREEEFRFSLDAVLLAHFASLRSRDRVADLGTGFGAVAFFLLSRGCDSVVGLDNNPRLIATARRSALFNGLSDRLQFCCGDVTRIRESFSPAGFDRVIANPPYRSLFSGRINPSASLAQARHELTGGLTDFIQAAAYLLKNRGRFALIHLPERLADILQELRKTDLEPKRLRFVHPMPGRPPKMVLVEAVKSARPGLAVQPPLIIHEQPGQYCREILDYYRQADYGNGLKDAGQTREERHEG